VSSSIEIQPVAGPLNASIRPPGSKSLTNRALVCAALAEGVSNLRGVLVSEDTQVMIQGLGALGIKIDENPAARSLRVTGCGGQIAARSADLYVANSGTTVRFLTALAALGRGTFRLHGTKRMHERPIQDLLNSLAELGVRAESDAGSGCPPVIVHADGLRAGRARLRGDISSQYLSAILMVSPCASAGPASEAVVIEIEGVLVSKPYVAMTIAVIEAFGGRVETAGDFRQFTVPRTGYVGRDYEIEPDASAASYFWAAAAIAGGRVRVEGLNRASLQGDVAFCECLAQMGCEVLEDVGGTTVVGGPLRGIDVDMNAISDTVQTLGVVALFADGPTNIRRVGHIRHKETDRIRALATELRKLGATVDELADGLRIVPGTLHGATIDTYDDHRMAMSLALAGLKIKDVVINDPQCTAKTYPEFFQDLASLTAQGMSRR
jgi:3-phosphoshikimate 1-carboxyvinyltransferase